MDFDLILLTQEKYIAPAESDWYTKQVLHEDQLVLDALTAKGLIVDKKDWADTEFDWTSTKTILFRSTWDYFNRFNEFKAWLADVKLKTQLINSAEQILWNVDKHYLLELQHKNIPIVESIFIPAGTQKSLKELHEEQGWNDTVLKPTVSGAGRHTYRLHKGNYAEHEAIFADLILHEDFILQPFQKNIVIHGEVSYILIDGKFSHAVHKFAKVGDYRVQDDFGGSHFLYAPSKEEIAFAENCAKTCEPLPLYARVDVIWDNENKLTLSELELIEPELWFRHKNEAADQLAEAIVRRLL